MNSFSLEDEAEFHSLLEFEAKLKTSAPTKAIQPRETESSEQISAAQLLAHIDIHGLNGLPNDILKRVPADDLELLGPVLFDLYELSQPGTDNTAVELWFSPSPLLQSGIPASKPESGVTQYHSVNGNIETTLSIPIETLRKEASGMPYGIPGRLALAYLTTACLRSDDGFVSFSGVKSALVANEFGKKVTNGSRGSVTRYPESIESWAKVTIQFSKVQTADLFTENGLDEITGVSYKPIPVATDAFLWSSNNFKKKGGGWIQFSPQFIKFAEEHAVPVDFKMLSIVADLQSPHAYDLYYWCIWRIDAMERAGDKLVRISWHQLHKQLLPQYKVTSDAVKEVLDALKILENSAGIKLPLTPHPRKGLMLIMPKTPILGSIKRKVKINGA